MEIVSNYRHVSSIKSLDKKDLISVIIRILSFIKSNFRFFIKLDQSRERERERERENF